MQDESIKMFEFLNSTWGHAAVWFGALWAFYLFINKVSKDAEEVLHPQKRKALSDELLRIKDRDASSWVPDFTLVFDRFFGEKHLSWRCFYRSSLISVLVFTVLNCIISSSLLYVSLVDSSGTSRSGDAIWIAGVLATLFMIGVVINAPIDYISLLETRILLLMPIPIFIKIAIDIILTFLLSFLWLVTLSFLGQTAAGSQPKYFEVISVLWVSLTSTTHESGYFVLIIVATSFTTSVWLWLHGLSRVLIRGLSHLQKFMGWLNVKETPLRAIGTTINLIVLTFGVLLFPVYLFY